MDTFLFHRRERTALITIAAVDVYTKTHTPNIDIFSIVVAVIDGNSEMAKLLLDYSLANHRLTDRLQALCSTFALAVFGGPFHSAHCFPG
jgi:hypothetical protein